MDHVARALDGSVWEAILTVHQIVIVTALVNAKGNCLIF